MSELRTLQKEQKLTDQQERFVLRYLVDFDRRAAIDEAGYNCTTVESKDSLACALLSNHKVRAFLWNKKAEYAEQYKMNAEQWFRHLVLVAMEAYEAGEWTACVSALREIGRHLGCYERDNSQKLPTREEAQAYVLELQMRGIDLTRKNAPPHLRIPKYLQPGEQGEIPGPESNGELK